MKDVKWFIHRFCSMSPIEYIWRLQQKLLQYWEYRKIYLLHLPVTDIKLSSDVEALPHPGGILLNLNNLQYSMFKTLDLFSCYDYENNKKAWNAGFQTSQIWPEKEFSYNIFVGQRGGIGDIRTNWELNRHYQFVCLAKNYFITCKREHLDELLDLFTDWNRHNLFLHGVEWSSTMEVAIRTVSWIYTYTFLDGTHPEMQSSCSDLMRQLRNGIQTMTTYILLHRSRFSSANNHLIIEMFAVALSGIFFRKQKWIDYSLRVITSELCKQNYSDGVNREMSMHYQCFVMEAYGILYATLKKNGFSIPDIWKVYLTSMSRFVADCCGDYGEIVQFGDNDEGKLLDFVGKQSDYCRHVLHIMGMILEERYTDIPLNESIRWLFDEVDEKAYTKKTLYQPPVFSTYVKGGYTILRSLDRKLLIGFDHACLGFGKIAAHAHADALSIQVFYCGKPVLIDSGTYCYHISRIARDAYRSTKAHNTVYIDGVEQAQMLGPFLWGKRYKVKTLKTEHKNGYSTIHAIIFYEGVRHSRVINFDHNRSIIVEDKISGGMGHQIWHLGGNFTVSKVNENEFVNDTCKLMLQGSGLKVKKEQEQYSTKYLTAYDAIVLSIEIQKKLTSRWQVVER